MRSRRAAPMVGSACGRSPPTSAIRARSTHSWRAGCRTHSSISESCSGERVACDDQTNQRGEPIVHHPEQLGVIRGLEPWRAPCNPVSYTHLRAHETPEHLVCRLLLEKKKKKYIK